MTLSFVHYILAAYLAILLLGALLTGAAMLFWAVVGLIRGAGHVPGSLRRATELRAKRRERQLAKQWERYYERQAQKAAVERWKYKR